MQCMAAAAVTAAKVKARSHHRMGWAREGKEGGDGRKEGRREDEEGRVELEWMSQN